MNVCNRSVTNLVLDHDEQSSDRLVVSRSDRSLDLNLEYWLRRDVFQQVVNLSNCASGGSHGLAPIRVLAGRPSISFVPEALGTPTAFQGRS